MQLFSLTFSILLLTSASAFICKLCHDDSTYVYVNNTPCFEFGDCIDKGQDDNTFWVSQLDAYLRRSITPLTNSFKTIERKIYKPSRDEGNFTLFDGTPQPMCMPSQELSSNDAFLRKMHDLYRLSETARMSKIMTMDIVAQILARLQSISEALDSEKHRRINDRAPSDAMYLHQLFPHSTSEVREEIE
jgi:hypothetical protein